MNRLELRNRLRKRRYGERSIDYRKPESLPGLLYSPCAPHPGFGPFPPSSSEGDRKFPAGSSQDRFGDVAAKEAIYRPSRSPER